MDRTLVIHPGALGDVLLSVPALRALRRAHPDATLRLAAQSHVGELLAALGVVDSWARFESLRLDTLFVDGSEKERSEGMAHAARVVCWFGANDASFGRRLSTIAPEAIVASPTGNSGDVWRHLLATVGKTAVSERGPIAVPDRLVEEGRRTLVNAGWDGRTPLVIVHPGAGGVAKRWPVEGFIGVIAALRSRRPVAVVVHQGPADRAPVEKLLAGLDASVGSLDNPSLSTLAGALVQATAYVGNDSGISHLAAAVGAPSIVLFRGDPPDGGPAESAALRWRPWASDVETVIVSTRSLRPEDEAAVTHALERRFA